MSNGDDVLDNWEEIDEVELSTQLNQLRKEQVDTKSTATIDSNTETMPFHHQNSVPLVMMMRSDEDYGANYTQTNKPAVKILRRPTQQNTNLSKLNDNRPKQPIKTLQQREQEYAEARLRILGSAKNPEDELEANLVSKIVMKSPPSETSSSSPSLSTSYCQSRTMGILNNPNANISSISSNASTAITRATGIDMIATTTIPPQLSLFSYNMIDNDQMKPQDNMIVRMPRGPDGTSGFNFRR